MVLVSIASVQVGAALAKGLFGEVSPDAMVWMRLATSALVLLMLVRPRVRSRSRADWWVVGGYGLCLALMNWAIYQSFARIPLGVAVTIEFIGPLTVAVIGLRRPRDLSWAVLAGAGVLLLGWERTDLDWAGVAFALLAGAAWAGYILLSAATGRRWEGLDGLAVASAVAVLLATPTALLAGLDVLTDPRVLMIGVTVGLLSSVIPYTLELIALRALPTSTFSILMSVEPAAAAIAALMLLDESLSGLQWVAMACVIVASIGATRAAGASQSEHGHRLEPSAPTPLP